MEGCGAWKERPYGLFRRAPEIELGLVASAEPRGGARGRSVRLKAALLLGLLNVMLLGLHLQGPLTRAPWYRRALRLVRGGEARNLILVGWDGCLKDDVDRLLAQGLLPNVARLRSQGQMVDTHVTHSRTETKPGWAEILTGYGPSTTGVVDNRSVYGAIPEGYTVFERLKQQGGATPIKTIFLAGKSQNLGTRGRHKVRVHGQRKTWYDETLWTPEEARMPDVVEHQAEPYYYSWRHVDVFKNGLGDGQFVGQAAIEAIRLCRGQRFFLFAHFWEPDESGHDYGEGSSQYLQAMVANDQWLGRIMEALEQQGLATSTRVYLTTDHGFDRGARTHGDAPHTFVVTNDTWPLRQDGDRKDITPTVLERLGVDIERIVPRLEGSSLLR
jgi:Type I phosphodiesterase / nucleotide pyrophosphatase